MKRTTIIILLVLLLFSFSKIGIAYNPFFNETFKIGVNHKIVDIHTLNGNHLELRLELLTFDMLRISRFDFYNSPKGSMLRRNIAFNVYIENKDKVKSNFQADKIKLIVNNKEISSKFGWKTPIDNFAKGMIAFPIKSIANLNFEKLKLAIETKDGTKYVHFNRNKLDHDFSEKFRTNIADNKEHNLYISEPKLGVLNEKEKIEEKRNFSRNSVSNITVSFSLERPVYFLWFNKEHSIRCEWYNKQGFYKEELVKDTKDRSFKFTLYKDDVKESVGVWSVLMYIDDHLMGHRTFFVY